MVNTSTKIAAVLIAMGLAVGCIALAGSSTMPSSKRAHVDFEKLRQQQAAEDAATTLPATAPATMPANAPAAQP